MRLCRHAIALEFYQPENYVNLARTCMLSDRYRRDAFEAVREGLEVDSDHPELLELHRELGKRRRPVIPFLSRGNILNRLGGWFRHNFSRSKTSAPATERAKLHEGADASTIVTTVA